MTKIDFQAINTQLMGQAESLVRQWLPGGRTSGHEYLPLNPRRNDASPGSFTINLRTGKWMDGATGDRGGDLISLYAYINGINNGKAARELSKDYKIPTTATPTTPKPIMSNDLEICLPIPSNAPTPPKTMKIGDRSLQPSMIHTYLDAEGAVLRYIYRFEAGEDTGLPKKEFRPLTCWQGQSGRLTWRYKDIPSNRPLYGLRELATAPEKPVLVVSGEKCADAARSKLKNYVIITWSGGDGGASKTDWTPIKGRKLVWWPDNDASSKTCMKRLTKIYGGNIINIPEDKYPQGWDCADAVMDGLNLSEFLAGVTPATSEASTDEFSESSILAPDEIFPDCSEKGKKLGTLKNLAALMKYCKFEIWYDEITKRKDCSIAGIKSNDGDRLNHFVARLKSLCILNGLPTKDVDNYVGVIASMDRRNAVVEWVNSKPWDGINRVEQVINSVECSGDIDNKLKEVLMLKWMVSAWAATSRKDGDNFQTRGVIVFQGKQEIGKTNFLRTLCGRAYGGNEAWFGVGNTFNAESTDNIVRVNRYWICEFAELESTTRYSMGALKAFLTNPENVIRFKYAREETIIYSRTVYAGTVNQMAFLPDPTGNSRFWCIPVTQFNDISHVDMQQVWAEIKRYHDVCIQDNEKYIWWLSPEESAALEQSNNRHETPSSASDLLGACLDWDAKPAFWREATCTQLLVDCGVREDMTKSLVTQAGMYLQRMGLKQRNTGKLRLYFAPPRKAVVNTDTDKNVLVQENFFKRINN